MGRVEVVEQRRGVGGREVAAPTPAARVNAPGETRRRRNTGVSRGCSAPPSCSWSLPPLSGVWLSLQTRIKLSPSPTDLCLMSSSDPGRLQDEPLATRCLSVPLHHVGASQKKKKLARNVNGAERARDKSLINGPPSSTPPTPPSRLITANVQRKQEPGPPPGSEDGLGASCVGRSEIDGVKNSESALDGPAGHYIQHIYRSNISLQFNTLAEAKMADLESFGCSNFLVS